MLCGGGLDGGGPSEGDYPFYQITASFVSLEDAGLDQAGQTVAVVGETETLMAAAGAVKTLSRPVTSAPVESADSTR